MFKLKRIFWYKYVLAHSRFINRFLHRLSPIVGGFYIIILMLIEHENMGLLIFLTIPLIYGINWIGHLIQGNRPLSFTNPVESFFAYWKLISMSETDITREIRDAGDFFRYENKW